MDELEFLKIARERFREAETAERQNRDEALDDLRFLNGEQWPEEIRSQREIEKRPCLTFNLLEKYVRTVIGDMVDSRPAIKVRPARNDSSREIAEILEGMIRNIESVSCAEDAYDTGFESALTGGVGFWRVDKRYADDETFDMELAVDRIVNPFSVYCDPHATRADLSDAQWCFVVEPMDRDEFAEKYPNVAPVDFDAARREGLADWYTKTQILVAEYWWVECEEKKLVLLSNGVATGGLSADELALLAADGITVVDERRVEIHKVRQALITGREIIDGPNDWDGRHIPIIRVVGKEMWVENRKVLRSLIRDSKDPQRMFNYWKTVIAETIALSPKAPYIGPAEAFEGYEKFWAEANRSTRAYLPYNAEAGVAPRREMPPQMPHGAAIEAESSKSDIQETMGIYNAGIGKPSNERSGKAILARQTASDKSIAVFIRNYVRAIKHTGRVLIDLIPKVYDTERVARIILPDEKEGFVRINTETDEQGQALGRIANDIRVGKYDVVVDSGPSLPTMRMAAVETIMTLVQTAPQLAPFTLDLLAENLDFPGADKLRERLKAVTQPNLNPGSTGAVVNPPAANAGAQ